MPPAATKSEKAIFNTEVIDLDVIQKGIISGVWIKSLLLMLQKV